jgi:hypothetical protein
MVKESSVTLRMSEELKTALHDLAVEDRRSLSGYIEMVLERHVDSMLTRDTPVGDVPKRLAVHRGQSRRHSRGKKLT